MITGGFALLAALILGAVYFGNMSRDKKACTASQQKYEAERADDKARLAHWLSIVTDENIEKDYEDALYRSDETAVQEVRDSWHYYFGEDAPKRFSTRISSDLSDNMWAYNGSEVIDRITALRILMANRGKLTKWDAAHGIKYESYAETRILEDKKHAINVHFFNAINNRLQEHGIYEDMYDSSYSRVTVKPFGTQYSGVLVWRPMIETSTWNLSKLSTI